MLKKIIFFILFFFIPLTAQSENNSEIVKKFTKNLKQSTISNLILFKQAMVLAKQGLVFSHIQKS